MLDDGRVDDSGTGLGTQPLFGLDIARSTSDAPPILRVTRIAIAARDIRLLLHVLPEVFAVDVIVHRVRRRKRSCGIDLDRLALSSETTFQTS
jgi:hypothetical protein